MRKESVHFLLSAFVLLLTAISCQKKEEPLSVSESIHNTRFTFKAVEKGDAVTSKVTLGELGTYYGYTVLWKETDVAGVTINYSSKYVPATITPSADALYGSFQAVLDAPAAKPFTVEAVVPAHALASYNEEDQSLSLNIPASQTPTATSPDPMSMILVAEQELESVPKADEAIELPFHHATAYGCVTLTDLPTDARVDAIDLVFDIPVSGKWYYRPSEKSMTANVPSQILTLHTNSTKDVFFACAPGDQAGPLKLRLITEKGVYEHKFDARISFRSGRLSKFTVDMSKAEKKKSVSILGLGHSYAQDTYWYLFDCLKEMGYEKIVLGVMFKANCSMQEHVQYYHAGKGHTTYHKNTSGMWIDTSNPVLANVLDEREWDYITLQQSVEGQGMPKSFDPWLEELTDIVRSHQPSAKLFYNMLWAFDYGYTYLGSIRFAPYDYDQMIMYDAIMRTTQERVIPTGFFGALIPCGTAVQNFRTSKYELSVTRDKYHMSYKYGRLLTALMMCRVFCNESIAGVTYTPSAYTYTQDEIDTIKESLESAFIVPYRITPHGQAPIPVDPTLDPDAFPVSISDALIWDVD